MKGITPIKKLTVPVCIALFMASSGIIAQVETPLSPKHQIEFQHDNDFILLTDRYYSSGLFLTYRKRFTKGIFNTGSI